MAITWTKKWTSSDDGSKLTGTQLGTLQDDIASAVYTGNSWASASVLTKTTSYNASSSDAGKIICMNSSGATTLTLPDIAGGEIFIIKNINSGTVTISKDASDTLELSTLAANQCVVMVGDLSTQIWRVVVSPNSGATASRGTFTASNLTYTFTVSTPSVNPTAGATYTNNGITYTVVSYSSNSLVCTGTGYPQTSGTLTKATGTGDATLTFTAFTATLTITHNLALATAPYTVIVTFANNSNKKINDPDEVTYTANTMVFDFTSFTTMTGTYGYAYITG